jgi:tetratricopeptide (TPR) repeat protein
MKNNFTLLLIFSLMSFHGFAQKNQIKAAQVEFTSGNLDMALNVLNKTEYLIFNSLEEDKYDFYLLKGKVLSAIANKNINMPTNSMLAVDAYKTLIATEAEFSKSKLTPEAKIAIKTITDNLEKSAMDDAKANKHIDCAQKMGYLYDMNPKDTTKLFFSASYYMMAKNYDLAIKNYEKLSSMNFSGKEPYYYATDKIGKNEVQFVTKAERDLSVSSGTSEKPRNELLPSKKKEIYVNMAYIYNNKNDAANSEKLYKKIIELDPKNSDAYLRIAYIKTDIKKEYSDKMGVLGTSDADMKQYDELKIKRDNITKEAISYLEKAFDIDPKSIDISKLLLSLYRSLDMTDKYNALKAKM